MCCQECRPYIIRVFYLCLVALRGVIARVLSKCSFIRAGLSGDFRSKSRRFSRCLIASPSRLSVPFPFDKMPTINRKRRAVGISFMVVAEGANVLTVNSKPILSHRLHQRVGEGHHPCLKRLQLKVEAMETALKRHKEAAAMVKWSRSSYVLHWRANTRGSQYAESTSQRK